MTFIMMTLSKMDCCYEKCHL